MGIRRWVVFTIETWNSRSDGYTVFRARAKAKGIIGKWCAWKFGSRSGCVDSNDDRNGRGRTRNYTPTAARLFPSYRPAYRNYVCIHAPFKPFRLRSLRAYKFGLASTSKFNRSMAPRFSLTMAAPRLSQRTARYAPFLAHHHSLRSSSSSTCQAFLVIH